MRLEANRLLDILLGYIRVYMSCLPSARQLVRFQSGS